MDDRSVKVNKPNFTDFEKVIHIVFKTMNEWLSSNFLSQNLGKTHFMQFITKNSTSNVMYINYNIKIILNTSTVKFLWITLDNTLSWKSHIDMITSKLSQTCYMVRVVKPFLTRWTLKIIIMLTSNLLWLIIKYFGEIPQW